MDAPQVVAASTDHFERSMALCAGCAHEAREHRGVDPKAVMVDHFDGSCHQCGATLAGFFYLVPEGLEEGMSPGGGINPEGAIAEDSALD